MANSHDGVLISLERCEGGDDAQLENIALDFGWGGLHTT